MKYLIDGRLVKLVQKLDNGKYLVEIIYQVEEYDNQTHCNSGNPIIVDKIFDELPVEKYHKEITALKETINNLNKAHKKVSDSLAKAFEKFEKYKCLKKLEEFIDGKFTHYAVLCPDMPEIIKFEDTISENNRDEFRLLTLFGSSNGNLGWKLNSYRDDSVHWVTVMLCQSEEEAKKVIADFLYDFCTDSNADKEWIPKFSTMEKAQFFGAVFPDEFIKKVKTKHLYDLEKVEKKAEDIYKAKRERRIDFFEKVS